MERQEENLRQYIDSLDKKLEDLTIEEKTNRHLVENDKELINVVKKINDLSDKEKRLEEVNKFIKEKREKVKEAVKNIYGLNLDIIDFMKLQSGIEIIAFYDENEKRKRIIEYSVAKSLAEEFSKIQNANDNYQSQDYEANTLAIAKQQAEVNNRKLELDMIDIENEKEYSERIRQIDDPIKLQNIKNLLDLAKIKNANNDGNKIKYINIENMIALDEKNNIIESYYDAKTNQSKIDTPTTYNSSVSTIGNEENVEKNVYEETGNESSSIDAPSEESVDLEPTDFEKKEDIDIAKEIDLDNEMLSRGIYKDREEVLNKIKEYIENMDAIQDDYDNGFISEEEAIFYKDITTKYANVLNEKNRKKLTLENNIGNNGFVNIIFISILIMFLAFLLFLL